MSRVLSISEHPANRASRWGTTHERFFYIHHTPIDSVTYDVTIGPLEDATDPGQQKYIDALTPDGRPIYVWTWHHWTQDSAMKSLRHALDEMIGSDKATVIETWEHNDTDEIVTVEG